MFILLKPKIERPAVAVLVLSLAVVGSAASKWQHDKKDQTGQAAEHSKGSPDSVAGTSGQIKEDPSQYVGAETCETCHEDIGAGHEKGPHSKMTPGKRGPEFQGCEACHGPGKAHAESADPDKIIRFPGLLREESSRRCLRCHEAEPDKANFLRSEHAENNVGCIDCHSIHAAKIQATLLRAPQPQLCRSCHKDDRPEFSRPFHHKANDSGMRKPQ